MTNPQGFSTLSLFSEDIRFTDERQVGLSMMDHMTGFSGSASSPYRDRNQMDPKMTNGFVHADCYSFHGQNRNLPFGEYGYSLPIGFDRDLNAESVPYFLGGDKNAQYENSLFSSSLTDVFSRNSKISSNHAGYSHSIAANVAVASRYEDCFDSLEELEAKAIGNLLPDDDELLSGVTDGFDVMTHLNCFEETQELDLFSSVGGLEIGEDEFSQRVIELSDINSNIKQTFSLGYSDGEHPSRTLFVRNINSTVEDSELSMLFEQYGDIRTLYTACKHRGFVMISYYDIRAACNAMTALQDKPLNRRKLDIHFSFPKDNSSDKDINQGTLAIFNLDSSVSNDDLLKMFGVYGEVKEIGDAPQSNHKFVEFYDVRGAESALGALNKSEFAGKQIKLEPGGSKRFMQLVSSEVGTEEPSILLQKPILATSISVPVAITSSCSENGKILLGNHSTNRSSIGEHVDHPGMPSSFVSNAIHSHMRNEPMKPSSIVDSGHLRNHLRYDIHAHSLPEYNNALSNGLHLGSPGNVAANFSFQTSEVVEGQQFCRVVSNGQPMDLQVFGSLASPGRNYIWNNSCHLQPQPVMWPSSPSFVNGMGAIRPQQLPRAPHIVNSVVPVNNQQVGSAPSLNPNLWDRRHSYAGDGCTLFHPGSPHSVDFVPQNVFPCGCGNGLHVHHQRCIPFPGRGQVVDCQSRNRRNDGKLSQVDNKKQFELDIDRIIKGEDKRTTLMIKNIPNKYTSKMLLGAIDEGYKGSYDFIYLPIDFKNKCNVGYAFINMIEPGLIVPFHKTFNGKKWDKFNSEKVACLAYGRIQGKAALIAHFQNSSLMNEDKRCRPILFHTHGPNAGDQVPFPVATTNVRPRPEKTPVEEEDNNTTFKRINSVLV